METQEILTQMNSILSKVLRKKDIEVSVTTTASDVDGWDSLSHMIIIDSIEKHFGVKFKLNDIMRFNNMGDIVSNIQGKLSN